LDAAGNVMSPSTGFTDGKSNFPQDIAVDNSGNVWIANKGNGSLANSTLSEFVGAASLVMTPVFRPPGAAFDNFINANGYFNLMVVRTVTWHECDQSTSVPKTDGHSKWQWNRYSCRSGQSFGHN
jgi:secreted PhoX family phosphatase